MPRIIVNCHKNMSEKCYICPRRCGADRSKAPGVCGAGEAVRIARAAPHFWEEPCLSAFGGSGAVFFSGCNMKCAFCQNREISAGLRGKDITIGRLRQIYNELIDEGCVNINLVTPTHYSVQVLHSLDPQPPVPVVFNTSAYDSVDTLRAFEGKVQIYLPDLKYMSRDIADKYSRAPDYPEVAAAAIREMYRQVGAYRLDSDGIMEKGVIIRHLMLPGALENTLDVIDWVSSEFTPGQVMFSLMSQYTPPEDCTFPELRQKISRAEYERAVDYMYLCGITDGYVQDFDSADAGFIPEWDF